MKYLLLLNNAQADRERWALMSEEEAQAARAAEIPKWNALFEELGASGIQVGRLSSTTRTTAKTVRVRDGERLVTDGPYAETKEQIGGYLPDRVRRPRPGDRRSRRKIPVAERGSVEIRPLAERGGRPHRGGRRASSGRSGRVRSPSWPASSATSTLAEDAVQDAFAVALERWPRDGVPANPGAWIVTTARNRAIDRIRRERTLAAEDRAARPARGAADERGGRR